jgi:hypothetical protein
MVAGMLPADPFTHVSGTRALVAVGMRTLLVPEALAKGFKKVKAPLVEASGIRARANSNPFTHV